MVLKRTFSIFLMVLMVSGLALGYFGKVNAESSIPKPSVPQFTLKFVDKISDVPSTTFSTTDPYTNKTTTHTIPSYRTHNFTLEITIKNQPFPSTIDGNTSSLYYNVRTKPHFGENWAEQYSEATNIGTLQFQSSSEYTVLSFPADYNGGDEADFQVEAILGYHYMTYEYLEHLSPSYSGPYPVPVNHTAFVESSGWSPTQTFVMPNTSTPNWTHILFSLDTLLTKTMVIAVVALLVAVISVLLHKKHRRTNNFVSACSKLITIQTFEETSHLKAYN